MSNKLPLYAVDKSPLTVRVPVEVRVKLEMMAEETGIPVAALAATGLSEMVKDRPFGLAELARVNTGAKGADRSDMGAKGKGAAE